MYLLRLKSVLIWGLWSTMRKKKYKQCFYLLILFPHSFSCTWLPLGLVVIFFPHTVLNHNCSTCAELWSSLSCDQILQHVDTVNSVLRIQTKGLNPRSYVTAVYENVINVRFFFLKKKKKRGMKIIITIMTTKKSFICS